MFCHPLLQFLHLYVHQRIRLDYWRALTLRKSYLMWRSGSRIFFLTVKRVFNWFVAGVQITQRHLFFSLSEPWIHHTKFRLEAVFCAVVRVRVCVCMWWGGCSVLEMGCGHRFWSLIVLIWNFSAEYASSPSIVTFIANWTDLKAHAKWMKSSKLFKMEITLQTLSYYIVLALEGINKLNG